PLNNFWYPSIKIIAKQKMPDGRCKKIYGKPKTPFQRLLDSPDLSDEIKDALRKQAAPVNPVETKLALFEALAKLENLGKLKERAS
ncbi:MAG: transposase, partial [Spirochaetaceae bacterium]|nr:transposase [Spirochaetaceae bacterium]